MNEISDIKRSDEFQRLSSAMIGEKFEPILVPAPVIPEEYSGQNEQTRDSALGWILQKCDYDRTRPASQGFITVEEFQKRFIEAGHKADRDRKAAEYDLTDAGAVGKSSKARRSKSVLPSADQVFGAACFVGDAVVSNLLGIPWYMC